MCTDNDPDEERERCRVVVARGDGLVEHGHAVGEPAELFVGEAESREQERTLAARVG